MPVSPLSESSIVNRSEWWPEAERLKAEEGLSNAEIARRIGVTPSAVTKALNPEARAAYNRRTLATRDRDRHREVDKAWRMTESARGRCQRCGGLMGVGYKVNNTKSHTKQWTCKECRAATAHERALLIVEWWAAGLLLREIAERLGWSLNHVSAEVGRMRREGYELPHRYNVADRKAA